jgi:hypothetical protein
MDFANRLRKEMTEGIVRAVLEDAGYRVIDSGIERVLRELSCLSATEYRGLGYPDAMSNLPDFTVMTREQDEKYLVEVKYRSEWGRSIFDEVRDQVRIFGEIVLVSVNATAQDPQGHNMPSRFIRCCGLKFDGGIYKVEQRQKDTRAKVWVPVDAVGDGPGLWWSMSPLPEKFTKLSENKDRSTLYSAVNVLSGILDP